MSEPIVLVVKRGALRRFDALKRRTSDLQVEVIWDRRTQSRRTTGAAPSIERRTGERRRPQTFTWNAAEFTVAVPSREAK